MDFFILRKNKLSFSRYLGFEVFVKSTNFKFCYAMIDITAYGKLRFWLFLLSPRQYQIEIWSNVNATYTRYFQLVLKTETSSRPFDDFNKIAISWNLLIFGGWYALCLVDSIHTFKLVKNQSIIILGYWEIALSC